MGFQFFSFDKKIEIQKTKNLNIMINDYTNMSREHLKAVYHDTQDLCRSNKSSLRLDKTIKLTLTSKELVNTSKFKPRFAKTHVSVVSKKTTGATIDLFKSIPREQRKKRKFLVLNMASKKHFGGGARNGARAQEEDLFRKTDYSLHTGKELYPLNLQQFTYTKNVCIVKDDNYTKLPLEQWFFVDMIAMSAINKPYTNKKGNLYQDDYDLILSKIENIFKSALIQGCTDLVLGALGCGVFRNPPEDIVYAYNECLKKYDKYFNSIVFAIYSGKDSNFTVFDEGIIRL